MTTTIAIAGKGGTGKTIVAAFLIQFLADRGTVLAVDADPSFNLNLALGLSLNETVGGIREEMAEEVSSGRFPVGIPKKRGFERRPMAQIAVVTDSGACVPAELVHKYNIHVVPFELVWDGQSYRDGIDITPTEFYRRLRESNSWPTTSQPALGDFATLYTRLGQEVDGIISIHLSDELSATLQTARLAAEQASPVPVKVIDSRTAAIAEGFVVLAAARAAAAGGSLEEVAAAAEAAIPRVGLFVTLETLEYLHRGGRIGEAAALLGSRLRIHPVLYLAEGRVKVAGATRSRHRAVERMLDLMAERVGERPMCVSVFHADARQEVEQVEARVRSRFNCQEFYITEFTPVMGVHSGPGTIGLAFCARE